MSPLGFPNADLVNIYFIPVTFGSFSERMSAFGNIKKILNNILNNININKVNNTFI